MNRNPEHEPGTRNQELGTVRRTSLQLSGRSALVTGSVRGLGLAIVRALAAAGSNVMLNGFEPERDIERIVASLESDHGIRARYSASDLRDPSQISQMIADARDTFGALDILVNNAVVRHVAPIESFTTDAWEESIAVNLTAAFHAIRLVVPSMKARQWGRIVNVSSIFGLRGTANRVGYVTTKTALIGLTRAVAIETVTDGITCNAICPGTTETPIHEETILSAMRTKGVTREEAERQFFSAKQPTGRFIGADAVASLVVFLCSEAGRDITGAVLPVDGGWSSA